MTGISGQSTIPTAVAKRLYLAAVWFPARMTVSGMSLQKTFTGGNARLGLYSDNGNTPTGGRLLVDSGTIAVPATPDRSVISYTFKPSELQVLGPGISAWFAVLFDATITFRCARGQYPVTESGSETLFGARADLAAFGNLPNPCPTVTADETTSPLCALRIDSVI